MLLRNIKSRGSSALCRKVKGDLTGGCFWVKPSLACRGSLYHAFHPLWSPASVRNLADISILCVCGYDVFYKGCNACVGLPDVVNAAQCPVWVWVFSLYVRSHPVCVYMCVYRLTSDFAKCICLNVET